MRIERQTSNNECVYSEYIPHPINFPIDVSVSWDDVEMRITIRIKSGDTAISSMVGPIDTFSKWLPEILRRYYERGHADAKLEIRHALEIT